MSTLDEIREASGAAFDAITAEIRAKIAEFSNQPSYWESFRAFIAAVNWQEPWLIALLAGQTTLLACVILFRQNQTFTGAAFACIVVVVYTAERLNSLAARHWRRFAGQDYFDPNGVFVSAVVSAPQVFTMFVILIIYLVQTCQLLVKLKRTELRVKARRRAQAEANGQQQQPQQQQPQQAMGPTIDECKKAQ